MTNRSPIERSISYLLLGLILVFSISSAGNTIEFIGRYHKGPAGIALGVAFGTSVFIASYIAATAHTQATRATSIVIALGFGLASATFQMQIYSDGGASNLVAGLLAFLPITLGEVGLAVLEHLFAHDAPHPVPAATQPEIAVQLDSAPQPAPIAVRPEIAAQPLQFNSAPQTVQPEIALQDDAKALYLQRRSKGEQHMDLCRELQLVPSTAASWWRRMQLAAAQMQPVAQAGD